MLQVEQVWHSFHHPLKQFIVSKTGNDAAAEDILQDVFIKILNQLQNLKQEHKIKAWIYQITRNAIIDYYRKEKRLEELPADLPERIETENQNLNKEISACLRPFLEQLPEKYREALVLTEFDGHSQKELSELLGISFSGAKSRVQRGRQKLRELLDACCRFELDRYGNILDITPLGNCKSNKSVSCECCS